MCSGVPKVHHGTNQVKFWGVSADQDLELFETCECERASPLFLVKLTSSCSNIGWTCLQITSNNGAYLPDSIGIKFISVANIGAKFFFYFNEFMNVLMFSGLNSCSSEK